MLELTDYQTTETEPKENHITPSLEEIYKYIVEYEKKHLVPPTLRDISDALCISSTSTVHAKLKLLAKKGWIAQDQNGKIALVGYELVEKELPRGAADALRNAELEMANRRI